MLKSDVTGASPYGIAPSYWKKAQPLPMEDKELVSQIKAGYFDAFQSLVEKYQNRIIYTCFGFLKNREDAEDIAQEVFVEVYRSLSAFREDSKLSTWIYRIAITKSLDFFRKQNRKKRFPLEKKQVDFQENGLMAATPASNGPESRFSRKEQARVLRKAVDSLPENQRIVITLNNYEGFPSQEIAEILSVTLSAVEALIHRAKKNLRKKLRKYYEKHM